MMQRIRKCPYVKPRVNRISKLAVNEADNLRPEFHVLWMMIIYCSCILSYFAKVVIIYDLYT